MKRIMNWLMLSCKKATELMEKKSVVKLSVTETMQLKLHTAMCSGCNAYQQQSSIIDQWLTDYFVNVHERKTAHSDTLKEKIISKISGQ